MAVSRHNGYHIDRMSSSWPAQLRPPADNGAVGFERQTMVAAAAMAMWFVMPAGTPAIRPANYRAVGPESQTPVPIAATARSSTARCGFRLVGRLW